MLKKVCILSAIIFNLFAFSLVFSQEERSDIEDLSLESLLNLEIVTSSKKAERLIETPSVINVITAEEIRFMNFNTLKEVLEYVTGISSINGEGNIFTTTTIRGNTLVNYQTNTLLLFDGIPIYSPYHGSFDFAIVPLSSIERVEIVKGSNSVLYGTNAINAVINVISKTGDFAKGKASFGSFSTFHGEAGFSKTYDDYNFSFFVDSNSSSGENLTIHDEKGNEIDFKQNTKSISVVSKFQYKNFNAHFQFYNRTLPNFKTRGFTKVYSSPTDEEGVFVPEYNDEKGLLINLGYTYSFSETTILTFRTSTYDWDLEKKRSNGYWDYESSVWSNDIELSFNLSERNSNIVGVNYNILSAKRFKSEKDDYDIGKDGEDTNDMSFYLNGNYQISDKWKAFYGGRYYHSAYKDTDLSNFSLRGALTYAISDSFYVKALYGESFRVPTYFEKEVQSFQVIGNPNLEPEESKSYDIVFSKFFENIQFDVDFFKLDIANKITRAPAPNNPTKTQNQNIGEVSFQGVEVSVKFNIVGNLSGFGGYSYVNGENTTIDEDLKFTYENMVNFGLNYYLSDTWSMATTFKYLDDWGDADSYLLLNLGIVFKPLNSNIEIELKLENVLGEEIYHPEIARNRAEVPVIPYTMDRVYMITIRYRP